jgi:hypothetical protein
MRLRLTEDPLVLMLRIACVMSMLLCSAGAITAIASWAMGGPWWTLPLAIFDIAIIAAMAVVAGRVL